MAQVIELFPNAQKRPVLDCIRALLIEDVGASQEHLVESLGFVRRALGLKALSGVAFAPKDLTGAAKIYREHVAEGPFAVDEAMFCALQCFAHEAKVRLLDGEITGLDLGYGERYFTAMRALGLLALIWRINQGHEIVLCHANLSAFLR